MYYSSAVLQSLDSNNFGQYRPEVWVGAQTSISPLSQSLLEFLRLKRD